MALKLDLAFHCKGEAGLRLCMLCKKLVSAGSGLTDHDSGEELLTCSLVHAKDLDCADDSVDRLGQLSGTVSNKEFSLRQQAIGLSYQPHGLLSDVLCRKHIQPVSQYCHDWMHGIAVGGVLNTSVFVLLKIINEFIPAYDTLANYMRSWHLPTRISNTLPALFSPARSASNNRANTFKCSASEALSLYPILICFLQTVFMRANQAVDACTTFIALGDEIDLLSATAIGMTTPGDLK